MKRHGIGPSMVVAFVCCWAAAPALAEGKPFAGVDVGIVRPNGDLRKYSSIGGVLSPFAGYMLNDYVGVLGQLQVLGTPNKDRHHTRDDDETWALGAGAGPRLALPLGMTELYATWQAGFLTGLAPYSSYSKTSFAWSAGVGVNVDVCDRLSVGLWTRYNRADEGVHGGDRFKYTSGGASVTYAFSAPEGSGVQAPPPVPAAVAQPVPQPIKKKLVLRGVNFDYNQAVIRRDGRPVLDEAAETLSKEPGISVSAEGHTDGIGGEKYNEALSLRRAAAVREYLVKAGVEEVRISVVGYGKTKPVATNASEDGRAQNRRVELRIVGD